MLFDQDVMSKNTVSAGSSSSYKLMEDMSTSASENSSFETIKPVAASTKIASKVCCSCTKNSLCKTTKCKCRSSGGGCGDSCGCVASKCNNRKPTQSSRVSCLYQRLMAL